MLVRLLFWIGSLIILIKVNQGDATTYADEFYGRIRGPNKVKGVDAGVLFLIVFGSIVGGFFAFCILGTLIFGFFDNGCRCSQRRYMRQTIPSNSNLNRMNTHL